MDKDRILKMLIELHPLTDDFIAGFKREISTVSLPKNHLLLEGTVVAQSAFFLENGFAISYVYYRGRKAVTSFFGKDELIISPMSFFARVPAAEFIQLMDDSDLVCISYDGVRRLQDQFAEARDISLMACAYYFERCRKRVVELQNVSTRERYENILSAYHGIEQRVSQDVIASYLGITAPALSRLKRRLK